jgi:orotate phosphoribosyltransferase
MTEPPSAAASDAARTTARTLLEIGAVDFNPAEPFRLTSGRLSPVYIDCRKVISYPSERARLMDLAVDLIRRDVGPQSLDAVAGGETAGIPFAAWIAERMALPMLYVRKEPKGFGRMAQIEGDMAEGARVLLVEDLATDGASKVRFCNALRQAGAEVAHAFVLFHYGIFPESGTVLEEIGVRLLALATWWDVLEVAEEGKYFDRETLGEIRAFLEDPDGWAKARSGGS